MGKRFLQETYAKKPSNIYMSESSGSFRYFCNFITPIPGSPPMFCSTIT